jgi:tetratricopeptide (TPR) repeat protein
MCFSVLMIFMVLGTYLPARDTTVTVPDDSQRAMVSQRVGITDITITYHSPGVKKREIWGNLVPYDKVWRAGANENTTISFTNDVKVEGKELAGGTYGLHMIPGKEEWIIIFSKNHTSWGSYFYKEEEDALRVNVKPEEAPFLEWMSFDFTDRESHSVTAALRWEKLRIPFKITVDVEKIVLDNMRKELRSLPWWYWQGTYGAAQYCLDNNVNLEEALTWVDQSINVERNLLNSILKSQLLEKMGKKTEADRLKNEAMKSASEQELIKYAYSIPSTNLKKAEEIMLDSIKRFNSWLTCQALARFYNYYKEKDKALKYYQLALKKAPADQKEKIQAAIEKLKK